jgi:predicted flap endonuclease-1-like 5' DNA nuclease/predicted  nucleic acid-binding Zn-ribbon protein
MSTLVAQHPWLILSAVFLLGYTVKYLLDIFFLRQRLFDAEAAVERRGKDLDSERYAHGRTQAELKGRLAELDTTQKARTLAESLLGALKAKHAETEAALAAAGDQASGLTQELTATRTGLEAAQSELCRQLEVVAEVTGRLTAGEAALAAVKESANALAAELADTQAALESARNEAGKQAGAVADLSGRLALREAALAAAQEKAAALSAELTTTQAKLDGAEGEARQRTAAADDLALRLAAQEAELATAHSALGELRANLERVAAENEAAGQRIPLLERDRDQQLAKANALGADLQVALRGQADAQSSAGEAQSALASTQSALTAARKAKAEFEAALTQRETEAAAATQLAEETAAALAKSQHEAATLRARIEKLELALTDAKSDTEPLGQKLRARQDDVKDLTAQLGEATEELAALRAKHAQTEANLLAATETRAALEAEVRAQDGQAATQREQLVTQLERVAELEAELKAVSEAHAALQEEIANRPAAPAVAVAAPVVAPPPAGNPDLLAELEAMTRERNDFAAELATLRASLPAPTKRTRKSAPAPAPVEPAPAADPEEYSAACPQHLAGVTGIGPDYEPKLFAAGVGSYWELSQLNDSTLADVLELNELERSVVDFDGIRHDAARLARETKSVGRKWSGAEPDDLKAIEGITPSFEKRLYDAGLCTFAALAAADPEKLAEICPGNSQRPPDHAGWIALARARTEAEG